MQRFKGIIISTSASTDIAPTDSWLPTHHSLLTGVCFNSSFFPTNTLSDRKLLSSLSSHTFTSPLSFILLWTEKNGKQINCFRLQKCPLFSIRTLSDGLWNLRFFQNLIRTLSTGTLPCACLFLFFPSLISDGLTQVSATPTPQWSLLIQPTKHRTLVELGNLGGGLP